MSKSVTEQPTEFHTATVESPNEQAEEASGSLLAINGTILFVALSFVIFTLIMQKIFYKPLNEIRRRRAEYLQGIKDKANHAVEETNELQADYDKKIGAARQKVLERKNNVLEEAHHEKEKILSEKKKDVDEFIKQSKERISHETDKAFDELKGDVSSYAIEISKKILGEEVTVTNISRETIDNLVTGNLND